MPALRRLRQEDLEFEASLGYTERLLNGDVKDDQKCGDTQTM
jgi:hypothetical protein